MIEAATLRRKHGLLTPFCSVFSFSNLVYSSHSEMKQSLDKRKQNVSSNVRVAQNPQNQVDESPSLAGVPYYPQKMGNWLSGTESVEPITWWEDKCLKRCHIIYLRLQKSATYCIRDNLINYGNTSTMSLICLQWSC
jgi:hypothetical protein